MHGAQQAGGEIASPLVEGDPLFERIRGNSSRDAPTTGSLPNHFVVKVEDKQRACRVAQAAVRAMRDAWTRVSHAVWERFVSHAANLGSGTEQIWQRQIENFWEVIWVVHQPGERGVLERRKCWRSHHLPEEPGDKCSVMPDLQELSGYVRAREREKQDRFWQGIRAHVSTLDLRENERLCAIAFVKRFFPKVAQEALGWEVDTVNWPSTVYVAAVPWLRDVVKYAPDKAKKYAEIVRQHAEKGVLSESPRPFEGLATAEVGDFLELDANYLHVSSVLNPRLTPLRQELANSQRRDLADFLQKRIYEKETVQGKRLGAPSVFYAFLLADGDRLGKLVGDLGRDIVGKALAEFTQGVAKIVEKYDGVTIYAGGDDALAMLPVPSALECARDLAGGYKEAFRKQGDLKGNPTLSASVVFAHVRMPLRGVISEAHRLLDDVAKDANGRDSLAVGVYKRGGLHCQWVTAWRRNGDDAVGKVGEFVELLKSSDEAGRLSVSLLFRLQEAISLACGWSDWRPGTWRATIGEIETRPLLRAEILRTLSADGKPELEGENQERADADACLVDSLIGEVKGPDRQSNGRCRRIGVDVLWLAQFLATGGHEEEHL